MADGVEKNNDFYAVLGLKKDCTTAELRNAYKKLALIWHPDRCSASGSAKHLEDAKKKFQAIQQAYSVLSNSDKRFLYDLGVYDCEDDDDENGMGDFLNEMVSMMSQSNENGNESLEELQELFYDLFDSDINSFGSSSSSSSSCSATPPTYFSLSNPSYSETHCKRNFSTISGKSKAKAAKFEGFSEDVMFTSKYIFSIVLLISFTACLSMMMLCSIFEKVRTFICECRLSRGREWQEGPEITGGMEENKRLYLAKMSPPIYLPRNVLQLFAGLTFGDLNPN